MSATAKTGRGGQTRKMLRDPILSLTILVVLLFLLIFIIYPLFSVLKGSVVGNEGFTFHSYIKIFGNRSFRKSLLNTIVLGTMVGILSVSIGFIFAYAKVYLKSHFSKLFGFISVMPMVSPPFVLALSAITLFGQSGLITKQLLGITDFNVFGFKGLVIVQTMTFFPVAYMSLVGQLQQIDPSLEDAAHNMGASRGHVFRTVTLPLMMPGIANAFLVAFIEVVADFSNPMLIGGNYSTLATSIYMQAVGNYDNAGGSAMSVVLLIISLTIFLFSKFYIERRSYITVTGKSAKVRTLIENKAMVWPTDIFCLLVTLLVILFYAFVPLSGLFKVVGYDYTLTLEHFQYVFNVGGKPIKDTLFLSFLATPITGILAMIIAYLVVRKRFAGRGFMEITSLLAMAVPGTVLGLGYIQAFNTKPLLLTGTALILVIAFIVRSLPVGVRSGIASLQQIDPAIEESASNLGASSAKVFTSVTLPLIKSAFLSGLVFAFVRSMTAVSAVVFLVTPRQQLLTSAIMAQVDGGRYGVACAYSTVMIVIVLICIGMMQWGLARFGKSKDGALAA